MKKFFVVLFALSMAYTAQAQNKFEGTNSVYLQYDAISLDELSLNGLGVGYTHSWGVDPHIPLYVQGGIGFQYAFGSKYGMDFTMYSLGIPVNIGYHFQISDNFGIGPYLGINVRYYLSGKADYEGVDIKLFDSDEGDWNAFAFGWQIGGKAVLKKFLFGISYGIDFTEMAEDADKIGSLKITLGYNF